MKFPLIAAVALVAACTPTQQATVDKVFVGGQQFCQRIGAAGPVVVALADANGAPITVTNRAATDVALGCAAWNAAAVPVPPPPSTTPVPTVVVTPVFVPK